MWIRASGIAKYKKWEVLTDLEIEIEVKRAWNVISLVLLKSRVLFNLANYALISLVVGFWQFLYLNGQLYEVGETGVHSRLWYSCVSFVKQILLLVLRRTVVFAILAIEGYKSSKVLSRTGENKNWGMVLKIKYFLPYPFLAQKRNEWRTVRRNKISDRWFVS